ncbi:hypothetical protein GCM10009844_15690 [Nocardioides koreensis]|uniref:DUF6318 domain-containing protein n=1 Tax=Nocardioides koreensis TaxID=433651 RepID=A0ABN2ZJX2_9ACTN
MNRSRLAVALGLALPVLLVGGCSDDPVPQVAPHESPAPSVSESSSPQALGPVATVRAWIKAQNFALQGGDTDALRELSAHPCKACDDFIEPIEDVYAKGGRFDTRGWKIEGAKARSGSKQPVVVDTAITISGGKTVRSAGSQPVAYEAEKHIMVFKVVQNEGRWAVSFIGFIS